MITPRKSLAKKSRISEDRGILFLEKQFTAKSLTQLVNGDTVAIRVQDFYDGDTGDRLGEWIMDESARVRLEANLDTNRKYPSYNRCEDLQTIYETEDRGLPSRATTASKMKAVVGRMDPLSEVLRSLSAAWPHGAEVSTYYGEKEYAGKGWVYAPGTKSDPHTDESDECPRNFAANVYLIVPERGGELLIMKKPEIEEWLSGKYGAHRELLMQHPDLHTDHPRSSYLIKPQRGELIIFDSSHYHAVRPSKEGYRVTFNMFIKMKSTDGPFLISQ